MCRASTEHVALVAIDKKSSQQQFQQPSAHMGLQAAVTSATNNGFSNCKFGDPPALLMPAACDEFPLLLLLPLISMSQPAAGLSRSGSCPP
jgi:hypothetical protein